MTNDNLLNYLHYSQSDETNTSFNFSQFDFLISVDWKLCLALGDHKNNIIIIVYQLSLQSYILRKIT